MALNKNRLKSKIIAAFEAEQTEQEDYVASLDRIADKLAQCMIDEIKQLTITYNSGLLAPNGAVSGTFNTTLS
ncbi:hypothetical protein GCM10022289_07750 [Pedobacter jeongneungensis]|uniref:Uncharacterized protein n=1 Tax=Pedobacter jeongneungensis TaxID=947309 RepID=A0ABP8B5T6_9SPHI